MKKLKICLVSKYPPHKGGTSSGIYWYARTLGSIGIRVHVVTDVPEGRNTLRDNPEYESKNVIVHAVKTGKSLESTVTLLADKIVKIVKEFDIDILDSKYLIPYCIAAKKAKEETGLPLVIKHGGTDLHRLKEKKEKMLLDVLRSADLVSTSQARKSFFIKRGVKKKKLTFEGGFGINHEFFGPHIKPFDISVFGGYKGPVIGIFGKITYKRGLKELMKALSSIDLDYTLLLVPEDKSMLKEKIKEHGLDGKTIIMDYQPPWVMPSLYSVSDIVVAMDVDMPIKPHIPLTAVEALNAGVCLVTNKETHEKPFFTQFKDGKSIVIVDIHNAKNYRKKLMSLMKNINKMKSIGLAARAICKEHEGKLTAKNMLKIYEELL